MSKNNEQEHSALPAGPRTVAEIREQGNHLRDEPSVYLQQHAYNPIDWYPWGEEALARSRDEDKPIFLSIGYSSCHWCHVMEHEVFEHDDVAEFMNEHFVCIKVDREERPDLDMVYMEAVQMMTGRGGWPMSVFLTPELKPFYGGTYFPHDHFLDLTRQIVGVYRDKRADLENQAAEVARRLETRPQPGGDGRALEIALVEAAVDRGKESFDQTFAGFNQEQKFPTPVKWRFLLHEYRRNGDEELGEMIRRTCEALARGGIYDHVGGGFHRYTVDRHWTVPHFEKMLYDNGQLAGLMLEAGVAFDNQEFLATGTDVLDFLLREMQDSEGGIYSSYDADSGGEEGTYYIWSRDDIVAAVGPDDGPALADVLGISEQGNFEHSGKSVLTMRANLDEISRQRDVDVATLQGMLARHRGTLRKVRDDRVPPGLDRKIITAWNGLTITSLAQGYAVTGNRDYLDGAARAVDFLLQKHRRQDGSLWRTSSEGTVSGEGVLDDYAFLAEGLLELYQVTPDRDQALDYLRTTRHLVDFVRENFGDNSGAFYMTGSGSDAPLGRTVDFFDSVVPSGTASMFVVMIKLAAITGETIYLEEARTGLGNWTELLERAGLEMAWWFDAAVKTVIPFYDVVIAGSEKNAGTADLIAALVRTLPAGAVLSRVPGDGPDKELLALAPALSGKKAIDGKAAAYVCEFGVCQAPTTDPAQMMQQVFTGWKH